MMPVFEWEINFVDSISKYRQYAALEHVMELASDFPYLQYLIAAATFIFAYKFGYKWAFIRLSILIMAVTITDIIARRGFKAYFQRPRPAFLHTECLTIECWGFVSNHAANIAVVATVLILFNKKNMFWAIPVALLVGISRIFLVKHFPLDVVGGWALGAAIGCGVMLLVGRLKLLKTSNDKSVQSLPN